MAEGATQEGAWNSRTVTMQHKRYMERLGGSLQLVLRNDKVSSAASASYVAHWTYPGDHLYGNASQATVAVSSLTGKFRNLALAPSERNA
jgi:hypothetical protein